MRCRQLIAMPSTESEKNPHWIVRRRIEWAYTSRVRVSQLCSQQKGDLSRPIGEN